MAQALAAFAGIAIEVTIDPSMIQGSDAPKITVGRACWCAGTGPTA
jgi:hypothetical protein